MFRSHGNQCICANQNTGCYIMGIMALNDVRLWFGVANQTFTKLDPVYQGYTVLLIFSQRTVKAYGTFILTSWF